MEYLPIRINTLRPNAAVNFDIYIQLGERKVHYIRDSDPMEAERLDKLKKKGVKKLFIETDSESKYLDYLETGLNSLNDTSKNLDERSALAHDSMVTAAENVERNLETEQGYRRTEAQFSKIVEFLMSDRGAIKKILENAGCSLDNHAHAATVSTLSLSLATRLEIKNSEDLLQLGIAGLVHDLGKNSLNFDPMTPRDQLTPEQRKDYERHPATSVDLLSGKPFITPRVLGLVADHEEVGRGKGFPKKKDLSKLKKVYQIFNLCNDFDRICFEKKLEPMKAIDPFFEERGELFDENLITTLATVLT